MVNKPKKDLSKYKYGLFYFDPEDENLIVAEANPTFGWTLNFAKPLAYVLLLVMFLLLMLIIKLF
jgi:uncharacterized membrane protein